MPPISVSFRIAATALTVGFIIVRMIIVFERFAAIFVGGTVGTDPISAKGTGDRTVSANGIIADITANKTIRTDRDAADVTDGNAVDFFEIGNTVGTDIFACTAKGAENGFQTAVFADDRAADGAVVAAERTDRVFAEPTCLHQIRRTVGTHERPAASAFGRTFHDHPRETFVTFDDIHLHHPRFFAVLYGIYESYLFPPFLIDAVAVIQKHGEHLNNA